MISVPKKTTEEVDWTTPIRNLIAQSYGESPDNYAAECAQLQRCRQDAVRGAGSDITARDLLYKYFGQLELLELRFPEIKVTFPWHDAFTHKLTTQTSIAFEKASILFQIASTHSSIATSQSRADPEGFKRAFYYLRSCAGMLTYINDNFLHAPSTDLSKEVVKFLSGLILAQATEVFYEKSVEEKKGSALVAKVAAQAGTMYTTLGEEVKEFMGKGIFDRNWVTLIQIKSKYFSSLSQYHRSLADSAASKHGDVIVRLTLAETLAKEAHRLATSFSPSLTASPTLPADTGPSLLGLTKTHSALCSEHLATSIKENDLIYHALLPSSESLPKIDGLAVATPIPIHEVYGTPEVQKTIGKELFGRILPLSVHESASVYSEEKAKLVRGEAEGGEEAEARVRSLLDSLGLPANLARYRAVAEGQGLGGGEEAPQEVRRAQEDVQRLEREGGVEAKLPELGKLRERVGGDLDSVSRDLEIESRECEEGRVKWEHKWTQEPSAGLSKPLRTELKSHLGALEAAGKSDAQVGALWGEVRGDIGALKSGQVEALFSSAGQARDGGEHLLDLDVGTQEDEEKERAKIGGFVAEIEERLSRLSKIARERNEILKELKEKIQTDDVSHLLLLNRRNSGVEPALFAAELEKFRPFQHRLALTLASTDATLSDIRALYTSLRSQSSSSPLSKRLDERERRKRDLVRRFEGAKEGYVQVRDGLERGLAFYKELGSLVDKLKADTRVFMARRREEREGIVRVLERDREKESVRPPLAKKPPGHGLEQSFGGMSLNAGSQGWQQQALQQQYRGTPPPPQQYGGAPYSSPPPPAQSPSQYAPGTTALPPPPPQPQYHTPPPQPPYQPPPPAPAQTQYQQHPQHQRTSSQSTFLPPPPPRPTQSSYGSTPPAGLDPYASLGMFDAPPPPANGNPPQPQSYAQQGSYGQAHVQQQPYGQTQPQQQQQQYGAQQQQPHQAYASTSAPYSPPPPPSSQYGYQQQGGFAPPPQPPSQQQGGYQQPGQGYGQQGPGYGSYGR
ncbi:hypothetical protein DXG01_010939 [Tephrocybe rancida]|nr:hypothetical protein DXG01_010939 [Tephrocybe rancida]